MRLSLLAAATFTLLGPVAHAASLSGLQPRDPAIRLNEYFTAPTTNIDTTPIHIIAGKLYSFTIRSYGVAITELRSTVYDASAEHSSSSPTWVPVQSVPAAASQHLLMDTIRLYSKTNTWAVFTADFANAGATGQFIVREEDWDVEKGLGGAAIWPKKQAGSR